MDKVETSDELRWLVLCANVGRESPDPRTKIGCLIVGSDGEIKSAACNTFPDRIKDTRERTVAPSKYIWIEHAERNTIYLAARRGVSTSGCTMVTELMPCIECARAIIQAGIVRLVINEVRANAYFGERYSGEHNAALAMLQEAGVVVQFVTPEMEVGFEQRSS